MVLIHFRAYDPLCAIVSLNRSRLTNVKPDFIRLFTQSESNHIPYIVHYVPFTIENSKCENKLPISAKASIYNVGGGLQVQSDVIKITVPYWRK